MNNIVINMAESNETEAIEETNIIVKGDVIGSSVYSERFVIKILLKLASTETLEKEISSELFEQELCSLWDMTAEEDVINFLFEHNIIDLISFCLPTISENTRLLEIIIGITANICCNSKCLDKLILLECTIKRILECIDSSDADVMIQVYRFANIALYKASDKDCETWLKLFDEIKFNLSTEFILRYSTNTNLLMIAFENLNTLSTMCTKNNSLYKSFSAMYESQTHLEAIFVAFNELYQNKEELESIERERFLWISLQIMLNYLEMSVNTELFLKHKGAISNLLTLVAKYYSDKFNIDKDFDTEAVNIVEAVDDISNKLDLFNTEDCHKIFSYFLKLLKSLHNSLTDGNNSSDREAFYEKLFERMLQYFKKYLGSQCKTKLQEQIDLIDREYCFITESLLWKDIVIEINTKLC